MGDAKVIGAMGFRDNVAFNKAMLAKQVWRLVHEPDSLAAQVLKSKYFKNGNMLEARVRPKPSLIWRSLCSSFDLVKEGSYQRVGNGHNIKIWKDKWILAPTTYSVQSLVNTLHPKATVSELILEDSGQWDRELISILTIPIS